MNAMMGLILRILKMLVTKINLVVVSAGKEDISESRKGNQTDSEEGKLKFRKDIEFSNRKQKIWRRRM